MMFGKRKEKRGNPKLKEWIEKAKTWGAKIPSYIIALAKVAVPQAAPILNAIENLKKDDTLPEGLKDELMTILEVMALEVKEVSERHENDMTSDSRISKAVRPIITFALVANYIAMLWLPMWNGQNFAEHNMERGYHLVMICATFYFGSRGIEKLLALAGKNGILKREK